MDQEKLLARAGWRAAVFDSPLRIVIAFVLTMAGIQASKVTAARSGFHGSAAYCLVLCFCLTPISMFYGYTFRKNPVWSATLLIWLGGGILMLAHLAVEALGIDEQWAWQIGGIVGVVAFMYLVPHLPRIERSLRRNRSNPSQ